MPYAIIIKGVGSFYHVLEKSGEVTVCKARGVFKNRNLVPLVGDKVFFEKNSQGALITKILPRTSVLERPAVANATLGVIVCTLKSPDISYLTLDKMLISNKINNLKSVLCLNKCDLYEKEQIYSFTDIYKKSGAKIIVLSAKTKENVKNLTALLKDNTCVFYGVSGSGKSTLVNLITGNNEYVSGSLSEKTQRGKNTTRHTQLDCVSAGTYIMDTPGFSSFDLKNVCHNDLWKYYDEFYDYSYCKYNTCKHIGEPSCAVKSAVMDGNISKIRYENYVKIYNELKKSEESKTNK